MAKYIIQGETLKAIADEVRELTDITDEINPNEMIANMEQVNADVAAQMEIIEQIRTALDGKAGSNAAEIGVIIDNSGVLDSTEGTVEEKVEQLVAKSADENIWYSWISGNKFADLFYGFEGAKLPRLNYESCTTLYRCFFGTTNIERIDVYINCPKCTSIDRAFGESGIKYLKGINTSSVTNASQCFQNSSIQIIEEPFDFSNVTNTNNAFARSGDLIEIRFVAETIKVSITFGSSKLTLESAKSIIDGLATVETAQTLTLHKDVKAKLTQTQLDAITGKNWNLA